MIPLVSVLLFMLAIVIAYVFISGFVWGAGYYPTPTREIDNAGELLDPKEKSHIFDLGCGFAKVILRLAKKYPETSFTGVEIDPLKFIWCKFMVSVNHLGGRVKITRKNLLDVDLSNATGIFVFLSEETSIMDNLREKIFKETQPQTRVVSYIHRFRLWEPSESRGRARLYLVPQKSREERAS